MQELNEKQSIWDEQTDRFLRNLMDAKEEKIFLDAIATDKEMKAFVTTTVLLIDGIRKEGQKIDATIIRAIKSASKEELYRAIGKKMPLKTKVVSLLQENRWKTGIVAAAAVVIGVFALNNVLISNSTMDAAAGISAQESYMRGGENAELEATLARIYNNVDKEQFIISSIVQLEEMYQKATDNMTDDEDDYEYEIGLYLAKAYIINNQKQDAKRILTEMHKAYPKDEKVSELLHQLTKTFFWE